MSEGLPVEVHNYKVQMVYPSNRDEDHLWLYGASVCMYHLSVKVWFNFASSLDISFISSECCGINILKSPQIFTVDNNHILDDLVIELNELWPIITALQNIAHLIPDLFQFWSFLPHSLNFFWESHSCVFFSVCLYLMNEYLVILHHLRL